MLGCKYLLPIFAQHNSSELSKPSQIFGPSMKMHTFFLWITSSLSKVVMYCDLGDIPVPSNGHPFYLFSVSLAPLVSSLTGMTLTHTV